MQQGPDSVFPESILNDLKKSGNGFNIPGNCSEDTVCWDGLERRKDVLSFAQEVYDRMNRQDDLMLKFHNDFITHLTETKQTKELVNELLELYKGSKFMVTVFKFFIPIVAAIAAAILWIRDHLK